MSAIHNEVIDLMNQVESLRTRLAEHEANARAYEEIIGKKTYREVAEELEGMRQKLTMLDGTLTLERGFGIDTHVTMLDVAKKAIARQIELERQLESARKALEEISK